MPLCRILCAAPILSCLICAALCREFQISDLGCFVDGTNGVRDVGGMKNIGLTRIGSSEVSQIYDSINCGQMTREVCSSACALGGFQFAALQAAYWCHCGNSYGSQGAAPYWECSDTCSGNWGQNCGGMWRNRVLRLSYTNGNNFFVNGNRTFVDLNIPDAPNFTTVSAPSRIQCVSLCSSKSSGCQAVIFSQQQRLCHLLEYAAVPAAFSSESSGDFFVRG